MSRYSSNVIKKEIDMSGKKVLRFTATWCQPCKMLAKLLEEVKTETQIEVIDIDQNSELPVQFGIRGVPTLVMIDKGKELKRIVGMPSSQAELETWLNS